MRYLKKTFLILSIIGILLFISSVLFEITLTSSDDIAMEQVISGNVTGNPDGHAYFIRYPLSHLLSLLYGICPGVSWYSFMLESAVVVCSFLTTWEFSKNKNVLSTLIIIVCLYFVFFVRLVIEPEWTQIAGVLVSTSIFLYLSLEENDSKKLSYYFIIIFLYIWGYNLRNSVALLLSPVFFLCFLIKNKKNICNMKKVLPDIVLIALIALLVLLSNCIHNRAYNTYDWDKYTAYTKNRSMLFDYYGYPNYDEHEEVYLQSGITREIYTLMKDDYNYLIPTNHFENINLQSVVELSEDISYKSENYFVRYTQLIKTFFYTLASDYLRWLIITLFLLAIILLFFEKKSNVSDNYFSYPFIVIGLLSIYLAYGGRLPSRVLYCLLLCLGFIWLFELKQNFTSFDKEVKGTNVVLWCYFLIAVVSCNFVYLHKANDIIQESSETREDIYNYCNQHEESIYITDFNSFSQLSKKIFKQYDSTRVLSSGGWLYMTPVENLKEKKLGIYDLNQNSMGKVLYLVEESRSENVKKRLNSYFESQNWMIKTNEYDSFEAGKKTFIVLEFK